MLFIIEYSYNMIDYKIIVSNDKALPLLWKESWQLVTISEWKMYFSRQSKRNIKQNTEITKEYNEFKMLYPKSSWITSPQVVNKINKLVKEWKYQEMIDWVTKYVRFVKVNNLISKFILNPLTFLNQERWKDWFDIVNIKLWASESWMNKLLETLTEIQIQNVLNEKNDYKKRFPKKEITEWIIQNIINKVLWIES